MSGEFKRAIPTVFCGTRLKSRLEASLAFLLAVLGMRWEYEPISFTFDNGQSYLPDFLVRARRLWVETRGYSSADGDGQIAEFAQWVHDGSLAPDLDRRTPTIWVGNEATGSYADPVYGDVYDYLVVGPQGVILHEYTGRTGTTESEAMLGRCPYCDAWFFFGAGGAYICRSCGAWTDDGRFAEQHELAMAGGKLHVGRHLVAHWARMRGLRLAS